MASSAQLLREDAKDVPNKPGVTNWVQKAGGLPTYIARIAGDLITERGHTTSRAIAIAVGAVRNWCSGQGNVKPETRAKACAAAAAWEAKKAASKLKASGPGVLTVDDARALVESFSHRANLMEGTIRRLEGDSPKGKAGPVATAKALLEGSRTVKLRLGGMAETSDMIATRGLLRVELAELRELADALSVSYLAEAGPAPTPKPKVKKGTKMRPPKTTQATQSPNGNGPPPPRSAKDNAKPDDATKSIQTRLTELGYEPGKPDGLFGKKTTAAVTDFQTHHGIKADGVVGDSTRVIMRGTSSEDVARLRERADGGKAPPPVLTKGAGTDEPEDAVAAAQGIMASDGQKVGADGWFGPQTERAVKQTQRRYGLKVDGIIGPKTWRLFGRMESRSQPEDKGSVQEALSQLDAATLHRMEREAGDRDSAALIAARREERSKRIGVIAARRIEEMSAGGALRGAERSGAQELRRLPDGTFAPKGLGAILRAGDTVHVPHRSGRGKVRARVLKGGKGDRRRARLLSGPDKGKTVRLRQVGTGMPETLPTGTGQKSPPITPKGKDGELDPTLERDMALISKALNTTQPLPEHPDFEKLAVAGIGQHSPAVGGETDTPEGLQRYIKRLQKKVKDGGTGLDRIALQNAQAAYEVRYGKSGKGQQSPSIPEPKHRRVTSLKVGDILSTDAGPVPIVKLEQDPYNKNAYVVHMRRPDGKVVKLAAKGGHRLPVLPNDMPAKAASDETPKVYLPGVGQHDAKKAGDLKRGDIIVWAMGTKTKVVKIEDKGDKVRITHIEGDGSVLTQATRKDKMLGFEPSGPLPPKPKDMSADAWEKAGQEVAADNALADKAAGLGPKPKVGEKPGALSQRTKGMAAQAVAQRAAALSGEGKASQPKVGDKVRVQSPNSSGPGPLVHTLVSIKGDTATVRTPDDPSLGGGAEKQVPLSSLRPAEVKAKSAKAKGKGSPMEKAPPGGWTPADKVEPADHEFTIQVTAMGGRKFKHTVVTGSEKVAQQEAIKASGFAPNEVVNTKNLKVEPVKPAPKSPGGGFEIGDDVNVHSTSGAKLAKGKITGSLSSGIASVDLTSGKKKGVNIAHLSKIELDSKTSGQKKPPAGYQVGDEVSVHAKSGVVIAKGKINSWDGETANLTLTSGQKKAVPAELLSKTKLTGLSAHKMKQVEGGEAPTGSKEPTAKSASVPGTHPLPAGQSVFDSAANHSLVSDQIAEFSKQVDALKNGEHVSLPDGTRVRRLSSSSKGDYWRIRRSDGTETSRKTAEAAAAASLTHSAASTQPDSLGGPTSIDGITPNMVSSARKGKLKLLPAPTEPSSSEPTAAPNPATPASAPGGGSLNDRVAAAYATALATAPEVKFPTPAISLTPDEVKELVGRVPAGGYSAIEFKDPAGAGQALNALSLTHKDELMAGFKDITDKDLAQLYLTAEDANFHSLNDSVLTELVDRGAGNYDDIVKLAGGGSATAPQVDKGTGKPSGNMGPVATALGTEWTPTNVTAALDQLEKQGITFDRVNEKPETLAAVIKAAGLQPGGVGNPPTGIDTKAATGIDTTAATGVPAHPDLKASDKVTSAAEVGSLAGKTVVVTGSIDGETRQSLAAKIEAKGGTVKGNVTSFTDLLIIGAKPGSKLDKARQESTAILPADEAKKLIESALAVGALLLPADELEALV